MGNFPKASSKKSLSSSNSNKEEPIDPLKTSEIHDERYYTVNRIGNKKGSSRIELSDCEESLDNAPFPDHTAKCRGRRPHLHKDIEKHYVQERITLDPKACLNTGGLPRARGKSLPLLYAFPACKFNYENQNSNGGGEKSPGFTRIVTDGNKNQLGLSYHPLKDRKKLIQAPQGGGFVADYHDPNGGDSVVEELSTATEPDLSTLSIQNKNQDPEQPAVTTTRSGVGSLPFECKLCKMRNRI